MTQLGTRCGGCTRRKACDDDPEVSTELRAARGTRGLGARAKVAPACQLELRVPPAQVPVTTHLPHQQRARFRLRVR